MGLRRVRRGRREEELGRPGSRRGGGVPHEPLQGLSLHPACDEKQGQGSGGSGGITAGPRCSCHPTRQGPACSPACSGTLTHLTAVVLKEAEERVEM